MNTPDPAVVVDHFGKRYGAFTAVSELSFSVRPGEIVGLVGANGAGKTTTLRAITGILRPTAGTIRVCGHDIEKEPITAKRQFAYIPDTVHPYDLLTVTEHLHFIALAYRVDQPEKKYAALLDELELADKQDEIASNLSRGMLQKLSLACAFLREPRVVILDEPLTGLDPRGIRNIKESIRRRARAGMAFLLSSHLLVLVEALCDQVMILHRGRKEAFGSLDEIRSLATLHADASLEDVFFAVTEKTPVTAQADRFFMNAALAYLWWSLLKRQVWHFCRGLRRPTTLIGVSAVAGLVGFMFYYRYLDFFGQLVRPASLVGGALVMLGGSVFKGFLQRGLVFEPADLEFLFTSPFTQRQLVLYRMLPSYLFAVLQGVVFLALFAPHLNHPLLTSVCLTLFQFACFHLATGAAIFAGTLPEDRHYRIRWMMLGAYGLISALYLHWAWGVKLVPAAAALPAAQWFFYPAVTLAEVGTAPYARELAARLLGITSPASLWTSALYLAGFGLSAVASLWLLLKLRANIFESSLTTTTQAAERRRRRQQGHREAAVSRKPSRSVPLPKLRIFRGVGAILWKNLIVARRCGRELVLALVFTLVFTGFLAALVWVYHQFLAQGGWTSARDVTDFNRGTALMLAALGFFLQWTFSFDFRRDGLHLVNFRTLPLSPFGVALAEVGVATAFCLGFQAVGVLVLVAVARLDWATLLFMALSFPAVTLALNGVWNLHYLLNATRRACGKAQSASAVGTLMVVALSFLIFYPASWIAFAIGNHAGGNERLRLLLALSAGLAVQYLVDFLLLLTLAKLFERFEVARDS